MSAPAAGGAPPADQKAGKTVEAVVAHGRSVTDQAGVRVGPGGKVTLPAKEVSHLRSIGFLVGADESFVATRPGPNVKAADGPSVRLAQ